MIRVLLLSLVAIGGLASAFAQAPQPPFNVPEFPANTPVTSSPEVTPSAELPRGPTDEPPRPQEFISNSLEMESAESGNLELPGGTTFHPMLGPLELKPTIQLRGRIEAEANMASQSAQNKAAIGDLQNGYGFRRVRLGGQGTIGDAVSWVSEVELAGGNVRLRDVFIGLDALPGVRQLRVGNFREPYSLEGMTSTNFITFLERSTSNVISPVRNWGVCGYWWPEDERRLFSFGIFRDGTGSNGQSNGDGNNWAYTTRLTGLPIYEPDGDVFRLMHWGGAFSHRLPPDGIINFTPRTGSSLLAVEDNPGSPFLPALMIPASNYQLYNLQTAGVLGPLSVQAEWSAAAAQTTNMGPVFVHGMYVYGSYFLTGEHRGYNRTRGSFDQVAVFRPVIRSRTDPRGGLGAFELATRFGFFDFNSANLPLDANGMPVGTLLYELTVGLNWYLNSYTRIMSDYTAGMPDKVGFGTTVAHLFGIRTAVYW